MIKKFVMRHILLDLGNGEKISFPDYYSSSSSTNRQDKLREILLNDTIDKIKQDLENRDESFLAAIISGEGFTQLNRLSDIKLEIKYVAILEELGAAS